jgi:hypothetical protein
MGREQRSRRRLEPGTVCYLCGQQIDGDWNRDHIPPQRMFGKRIKRILTPQLQWLPTHVACNSSYRADEEYVILSLFPTALTHDASAIPTPAARSVFEDVMNAQGKGHAIRLMRSTIANWGSVVGPRGELTFQMDWKRLDRVVWKIARGLYFLDVGVALPTEMLIRVRLFSSLMSAEAMLDPTVRPVLGTAPMGRYRDVFDYKWGCYVRPDGFKGHLIAMLWWASLLVTVGFVDPTSNHPAQIDPTEPPPEMDRIIDPSWT